MSTVQTVPIIDVAPFLAGDPAGTHEVIRHVSRACETIGFLVLTGHGIPLELQERVFATSREFFDLPEEEKLRSKIPGIYYGYNPLGAERVAYSRGEQTPPDLKANFSLGRLDVDAHDPYYHSPLGKRIFPANIWPERPTQFRALVTEYYRATQRLATSLMELFALALHLPRTYFADKTEKSVDFWRVLDYPVLTTPPLPGQLRIGAHTDYGTLTLVTADGPGLQVQTARGDWEDVPYLPGSIQVNLGDMMAQWTNDRWRSTMHRVLAPGSELGSHATRRMALTFFLTANYDVVIEPLATCCSPTNPPHYAPITAWEHLAAKLRRQFSRADDVADGSHVPMAQQ
ncbi:MAG: isopenicillin N synthase family oxygenase [Deltaproteobacteria bacterium]|nr:isopenicillin N synthase family oxygenase [Deltaproteobacteria bacterium]